MSDDSFSDYIKRERDRLQADREAIITQQRDLDKRLAEVNREFQAVDAYETAKRGKAPAKQTAGRKATGARQAGRSSKREGILEVIKGAAAGLSRREILDKMGLKGNKSGEMSVSNALTALTKAMHVRREGGKYHSA